MFRHATIMGCPPESGLLSCPDVIAVRDSWIRQRTEALINVAHPDLRDGLIKEAEKMTLWRKAGKD